MSVRPVDRRAKPRRARRTWAVLGIICVTSSACGEKPVAVQQVVRPVKVLTVEAAVLQTPFEYPGRIKAALHAEMGFEVPGRIVEFVVREGQRVQKGDVLARLDDRDYQAQLAVSQANLRKAQADDQRSRNILEQDPGAIARAKLDTDRRSMEVARAQLDVSRKAVEDTVLRAPFSGVMARKLVDDYQNVNAKDPVLILQNDAHLEIEVDVPERDVPQTDRETSPEDFEVMAKPEVEVSAVPGRRFAARVKEFTTTADPGTRTFQLTFAFANPDDVTVLPGMTAKVRLYLARRRATTPNLLVPANATLADAEGNAFVWLLSPDSMRVGRRLVRLGEMLGSQIEVLDGLSVGDQIAISGVMQLRDGMTVSPYVRRPAGS